MAEGCASRVRPRRLLPAVLVLSLVLAAGYRILSGRGSEVEVRRSFPAMGTIAGLIVVADEASADSIADCMTALVASLDRDLDPEGTGSLGRLDATGSCIPSPDLARLTALSRELTASTGGRFDPTIRPLVELWGFEGSPAVPDSSSVDSALALCGWSRFSEDGRRLVAEPGSGLDMGAIAAGYAADRAYDLAVGMGARAVLVDMGGEIRCGGRVWRIAVRHPRGDGFYTVIETDGGAVSTSGDYESFFIEDGRRWSHILDPATGWPAAVPASVTVMHDRADMADALSTALAVAGSSMRPDETGATGVLVLTELPGGGLGETRYGILD
ncbi:MAG TPA: FAD:protein FMN transferase [Candidatus Fermentibacter sp.]|nr:FAD:protein FMN transferase [Candidatus Fermentibacter sp.]